MHIEQSTKYDATVDVLDFGNQLVQNILRTPALISEYTDYLSSSKGFSCSTVLNHLRGIVCVVTFLSLHCAYSHIAVVDCLPLKDVIENLNRTYSKLLRAERSNVGTDTIEGAVFNGLLPSGGIIDLQRVCNEDKEWAMQLQGTDCDDREFYTSIVLCHYRYLMIVVTRHIELYKRFMELLISSFYAFAPQGRIKALATLTKANANALLSEGHTNSTSFKTYATYGYQPVISSPAVAELLARYLSVFRPHVVRATGNPSLQNDTSPAFLKFKYVQY